MRDRLTRRGLALPAGALAAAIPADASAAAVRPALASATVRAALQYTTGGAVSWSVANLAEGALKAMFIARLQVGTVALLIVAALASAAAMAASRAQVDGVPQRSMPGAAAAAKPAAGQQPLRDGRDVDAQPRKPTTAWGDGVVQTKGRVLTPDGKPIAGAQITLWWYAVIGPGWHHHTFQEARPRVLATTGPDGTFQASFPKSVMANAYSTTQTQRPWPGPRLSRAPTAMARR